MNSKNDKAFKVFHLNQDKSLSLYIDTSNSTIYQTRIYISKKRRYITRSTKTSDYSTAEARAWSLYETFKVEGLITKKEDTRDTFKFWTNKYLQYRKNNREIAHTNYINLKGKMNKLIDVLGDKNIKHISNQDMEEFFDANQLQSNNTKNKYISMANGVFKFAHTERAIEYVPTFRTFSTKSRDNPRPSFSFEKNNNEYQRLLDAILTSRDRGLEVSGQIVTNELYFVVMFIVHGFLRPTEGELFSLKHKDIKQVRDPLSLEITVSTGKTGYRTSNSTKELVGVYKRLQEENPHAKPDDYLFMNEYKRSTVKRFFQEQFRDVVTRAELLFDDSEQKRTLYSLRHTAIQMRLIKSGGKVNILWLAKNCGTSVEMIERYYAKYLPRSKEIRENLQTFNEE